MSINTNNFVSTLLKTDRLILKTGVFDDYLKVYEYDMTKLTNVAGEIEFVKQSAEDIKKNVYPTNRNSLFDWIIYLKDSGEPIGNIFAEGHDEIDKSNEIGYNLHPKYWGQGYMKEALIKVLNYMFSLGYEKIYCSFYDGNYKSKSVIEKVGFKLININEDDLIKNNMSIKSYRYIMTKEMYNDLYNNKLFYK